MFIYIIQKTFLCYYTVFKWNRQQKMGKILKSKRYYPYMTIAFLAFFFFLFIITSQKYLILII